MPGLVILAVVLIVGAAITAVYAIRAAFEFANTLEDDPHQVPNGDWPAMPHAGDQAAMPTVSIHAHDALSAAKGNRDHV